ncbi:MAG TPA: cytidylate kinase-like family protein [Anaerolineae bacterium]|nr:cytidylate kinase-like family protein [Anaerolineae bacterium]
MAVITISRELGSEGDKVADLLCQALGYCRMDKDILLQIAAKAGIDVDALLELERGFAKRARLVSDEMTSLYRKQASAFDKRGAVDDKTYAQILRETLEELAQTGDAVIVGRGGQMVLADHPNALHVRLYAPPEARARRLAAREALTEAVAQQRIEQSDEQKRQYIRFMFNNADWRNPKHYHLAIDTGRISPEAAAQIIILAARDVDGRR